MPEDDQPTCPCPDDHAELVGPPVQGLPCIELWLVAEGVWPGYASVTGTKSKSRGKERQAGVRVGSKGLCGVTEHRELKSSRESGVMCEKLLGTNTGYWERLTRRSRRT